MTLYNFVRKCTGIFGSGSEAVTGEMKDAFIALGFTEEKGYFP